MERWGRSVVGFGGALVTLIIAGCGNASPQHLSSDAGLPAAQPRQATGARASAASTCPFLAHPGAPSVVVSAVDGSGAATTLRQSATREPATRSATSLYSIQHADQPVVTVETLSAGASGHIEGSIQLGEGFHGIQHVSFDRDDDVVRMVIDGRAVTPFVVGSAPSSFTFEDGQPPPTQSLDASAADRLQALLHQASASLSTCVGSAPSTGPSTSSTHTPQDVIGDLCKDGCDGLSAVGGDGCGCCSDCCTVEYSICSGSAAAAFVGCEVAAAGILTPACVAGVLFADNGCIAAEMSCTNSCDGSSLCCGPMCSAGTTSQDCNYPHCSPGATCCTGEDNGNGVDSSCCDSQSDCCGGTCLEGIFAGDRCINQSQGYFCYASQTGDVCGNTCCPPDQPSCRSSTPAPICCASGAGDLCTFATGTECCPAATPKCLEGSTCCAANDTYCGGCCPPPGTCAGGKTCCNAPDVVCGTNCCDVASGETCTPARSRCCGGDLGLTTTPCGSDCCTDGQEVCLNDACCPTARACGTTCCAAGDVCNNGTCVLSCPDGEDLCVPPIGNAICCPLYQCDNPANDNICLENCCSGVCCGQGESCCRGTSIGGELGCFAPAGCEMAQ